jgi:hypothetical protein
MIDFAAPALELTLALVGKRRIDPTHLAGMKRDLALAFEAVATSLGAAAGVGGARLTLITGLADGADQIAGELFLAGASGSVERVLGAILPCPGDEFARNSPVEDRAAFERAAQSCAFITVLRGRLRPPPPDDLNTEIARQARRARGDAFAAQADALLQDADILAAIDDPDDEGEIGGTRHTLRRALSRGIPAILIHLGRAGVSLPRLDSPIERAECLQGDDAKTALAALVETATTARRSATKA